METGFGIVSMMLKPIVRQLVAMTVVRHLIDVADHYKWIIPRVILLEGAFISTQITLLFQMLLTMERGLNLTQDPLIALLENF